VTPVARSNLLEEAVFEIQSSPAVQQVLPADFVGAEWWLQVGVVHQKG
jgi:hypothetical protein